MSLRYFGNVTGRWAGIGFLRGRSRRPPSTSCRHLGESLGDGLAPPIEFIPYEFESAEVDPGWTGRALCNACSMGRERARSHSSARVVAQGFGLPLHVEPVRTLDRGLQ